MTIEDVYRYMISGYFGVMEMDSYKLKEYSMLICFGVNILFLFSKKTKLQDALLVLNKMDNAPMDLILDIKHRLKSFKD